MSCEPIDHRHHRRPRTISRDDVIDLLERLHFHVEHREATDAVVMLARNSNHPDRYDVYASIRAVDRGGPSEFVVRGE